MKCRWELKPAKGDEPAVTCDRETKTSTVAGLEVHATFCPEHVEASVHHDEEE